MEVIWCKALWEWCFLTSVAGAADTLHLEVILTQVAASSKLPGTARPVRAHTGTAVVPGAQLRIAIVTLQTPVFTTTQAQSSAVTEQCSRCKAGVGRETSERATFTGTINSVTCINMLMVHYNMKISDLTPKSF